MLYIVIMEMKFNIAIVGSGLTGSITSLALAKAGYKVALIDPRSLKDLKKIIMIKGRLICICNYKSLCSINFFILLS